MKKIVLIILFILITMRILQQLQIRPNQWQKSLIGKIAQNWQSNGFFGNFVQSSDVLNGQIGNYSDLITSKTSSYDDLSISNQVGDYDKHFFLKKRLMNYIKTAINAIINSIDVWNSKINFLRQQVIGDVNKGFSKIYYPSVSDLVTGLLLGNSQGSSDSNYHIFKITGTQHLMAISGFNLTFLVSFISNLYKKILSLKLTILLNICFLFIYLCLIGFSPGIIRAFLMFFISSGAVFFKRQKPLFFVIILSIIVAVLIDIQQLSSIGFQLSYLATIGIFISNQLFSKSPDVAEEFLSSNTQKTHEIHKYLIESIYIGVSAQILIFPLLIYKFHQFSIVSLLVTTVVSWIMPIILQQAVLSAICQFILPANILFVFSLPLFVSSFVFLFLLKCFAFSWALVTVNNFSFVHLLICYLAIGLIYFLLFVIKVSKRKRIYAQKYCFGF